MKIYTSVKFSIKIEDTFTSKPWGSFSISIFNFNRTRRRKNFHPSNQKFSPFENVIQEHALRFSLVSQEALEMVLSWNIFFTQLYLRIKSGNTIPYHLLPYCYWYCVDFNIFSLSLFFSLLWFDIFADIRYFFKKYS